MSATLSTKILAAAILCCISLQGEEILIAAATDLAPAEKTLNMLLRERGIEPVWNFGSSGQLARQVEAGAPFDLFLSANPLYVNDLLKIGFVSSLFMREYASGRLGLWPAGELKALAGAKVQHIAIPNPKHAPYGVAARQALERAGLWRGIESKIVYAENARQAYELARSGNADAVLTAWTFLQNQGGRLLPAELHDPIRQAGAVVSASKHSTAAAKALEFLTSPEGRKALQRYGLFPPMSGR